MMFCPKCQSIMSVDKKNENQVCDCGYKSKEKAEPLKEKIKKESKASLINFSKSKISGFSSDSTLPKTEEECPKCKHKEAHYWTMQTRSADEAETKFLKCLKCKHVWRDYG